MAKMRTTADRVTLVCTVLLVVTGITFGVALSLHMAAKWHYSWTLHLGPGLMTSVLLMAGCLLTLPCAHLALVVNYQRRTRVMLNTLVSLLSGTLLVLCVGLCALTDLSRLLREPDALRTSMRRSLHSAAVSTDYGDAFHDMQINLMCCGVDSPADWQLSRSHVNFTLPPSCCYDIAKNTISKPCLEPMTTVGCLQKVLLDLRCYINTVAQIVGAMILTAATALASMSSSLVLDVMKAARNIIKCSRFSHRTRSLDHLMFSPVLHSGQDLKTVAQSREIHGTKLK